MSTVEAAERAVREAKERRSEIMAQLETATADLLTASTRLDEARRTEAAKIPVDRSARVLAGSGDAPIPDDHCELQANGQQKGYVALSSAERAKGFVKPVRRTYRHEACGTNTTMALDIAETYARDPKFYSGTFCTGCRAHFSFDKDKGDFVWINNDGSVGEKVGSK